MRPLAANLSQRRRPARPAGFTLIELLTVIAIIATMITVLMPAVFRAMVEVKATTSRELVTRLHLACTSYAKDYEDAPPAAVVNPLATGLAPNKISGCQNMRLALLGYATNSGAIVTRTQGPAKDAPSPITIAGYTQALKKTYLNYSDEELRPHGQVGLIANDGTDPNIEVFVCPHFKPIRPMLYYRARGKQFHFEDNAVYCTRSGETEGNWAARRNKAITAKAQFFIIWAGPDGTYFTGDDFASVGY